MNAMNAPFAAGVTITELAPTTRISLRLADREAAAAALGLGLPDDGSAPAPPRAPAPRSASAPTSG